MNKLLMIPRAALVLLALALPISGALAVGTYQQPVKPVVKTAPVKQPVAIVEAPVVAPEPTPTPVAPPQTYTAPVAPAAPTLYDYASELGMSVPSDLTLVMTSDMPAGDDAGGLPPYGVYYSSTNTIYVRDGLSEYNTKNILAYEYMHYIYARVAPIDQRFTMGGEVLSMWNVQPTMARYSAQLVPVNPSEQVDEGISIMCTRMSPSEISDYANTYCNNYIPNRGEIL